MQLWAQLAYDLWRLVSSCQQLKYSAQSELPEKSVVHTQIRNGLTAKPYTRCRSFFFGLTQLFLRPATWCENVLIFFALFLRSEETKTAGGMCSFLRTALRDLLRKHSFLFNFQLIYTCNMAMRFPCRTLRKIEVLDISWKISYFESFPSEAM